ncbi:alpha/beta-hydrolase [Myriangium duriaei CBS 260.36]|uniref:Alpha/beta-hydrolase n=1 Tax=Myriangium duriaei CBS 260.36 TaxID=1168546 RepID=A0A9P4JB22_9PEZI|nr:alpha/beta-hydrolase [Myriangium duriaei CBS 260.36]
MAILPFKILWRFCFVRLDRAVPLKVTRLTSVPPYPYVLKLPSRDKHKIAIHIYIPTRLRGHYEGAVPVHVDFHGGGFFMGSCLEQAPFCAMIAEKLGRIVISVDYRMGPIHKFPAAIHDAEDVVRAVLEPSSPAGTKLRQSIWKKLGYATPPKSSNPQDDGMTTDILDPERLSLSGFSSGGNLALNLAISINTDDVNWPSPLSKYHSQSIPTLLFFPSFDQTILPHERKPLDSLDPEKQAQLMKPSRLGLSRYLSETYLSPEQRQHPRASPGKASLSALIPGTMILLVLCEIDSLARQSEEWVDKVKKEGKAQMVQVEKCDGMRHGWTQFPDFVLSSTEKQEKARVFQQAVTFLEKF